MTEKQIKRVSSCITFSSKIKFIEPIKGPNFIAKFMGIKLCSVQKIKNKAFRINFYFSNFYCDYAFQFQDISDIIKSAFINKKYLLSTDEVKKEKKNPHYVYQDYPIKDVLFFIGTLDKKEYCGFNVNMNTTRLQTFKKDGIICKKCGRKGEIFKLEKVKKSKDKNPHFNLYCKDGIMLTSDHINPVSKSKDDSLDNRQTLCYQCNQEKGDKVI